MDTQLIKVTDESKNAALELAANLILSGKVVGMPTETVYGLAANAYDENAVKEIFNVKGRPQDNPLIVHISDLIMLKSVVVEITSDAATLAKAFWPGPLTIVLPKTDRITDVITCGLNTVAVRMPSHPIANELIKKAGVPIAAPSANLSGLPSTTTAQHVYDDLHGKIPLILDGGPCEVGVESTVISLSGEIPTVLRPGIITLEQIREVLPNAVMSQAVTHELKADEKVESPGMKYKHYSPKADVTLVKGSLEKFVEYTKSVAACDSYAMCFDNEEEKIEIPCISYGPKGDVHSQARRLFSVLRAVDRFHASAIFVRIEKDIDVESAVYNRLIRAAANKVIEL
ncbi:MAG: L-threonylcarbamoyladenylate synthase [Oscillospiraceae bacterium]